MRVRAFSFATALMAVAASSALAKQPASHREDAAEWAAFSECPLLEHCYVGTVTASVEHISQGKNTRLRRAKPVDPAPDSPVEIQRVTGRDTVRRQQMSQGKELVAYGSPVSHPAGCA